jgi:hypothetical protein
MQKTNINPEILQQMLDSAVNAAEKGKSQFFTLRALGSALAAALPKSRPAIVDLNCGRGDLLHATVGKDTIALYGADIDPCRELEQEKGAENNTRLSRVTYDATLLYSLLKEIGFGADLFVLNPPWRLFWHRERLTDLAESGLSSVRDAFEGIEAGAPKGSIDSTAATLLMALDLCTSAGEGMLIANNNTLECLFFRPGAPHAAVAIHIWAHVAIPGNPLGQSRTSGSCRRGFVWLFR